MPADKKANIESAWNALKTAKESEDASQLDTAIKNLNEAWHAASEDIYKAQQQAQASGEANPGDGQEHAHAETGNDGNVSDADFEEVK